MATDNPPTYWFPNINFNPAFYEPVSSGGGGLTIAQANGLYLRKTLPDTDPYVITAGGFTSTNSPNFVNMGAQEIQFQDTSIDASSTLKPQSLIITNYATGDKANIGIGNIQLLSNGYANSNYSSDQISFSPLTVGEGGYQCTLDMLTGLTITDATIGDSCGFLPNAVQFQSGVGNTFYTPIDITTPVGVNYAVSSGGDLNLQCGTIDNVNIGTSFTTSNVNIATQDGRSVVLHLGDGNNTTSGGTVHLNNGVAAAGNTQIMNGANTTGNCNILTGSGSTGRTTIGSATSGTTINGTLSVTTLNSTSATTTQTIGSNLSTGNLNIASNQTTGSITVGSTSSNITMNGPFTINKPISVGYTATPTAESQIGFTKVFTNTTQPFAVTAGTPFNLGSVSLTAGVWMISASTEVPQNTSSYYFVCISRTTATLSYTTAWNNMRPVNDSYLSTNLSGTISLTATTTIYIVAQASISFTYLNPYTQPYINLFRATRIA